VQQLCQDHNTCHHMSLNSQLPAANLQTPNTWWTPERESEREKEVQHIDTIPKKIHKSLKGPIALQALFKSVEVLTLISGRLWEKQTILVPCNREAKASFRLPTSLVKFSF